MGVSEWEAERLEQRDETLMGLRCAYQVTRYDPYLGHLCGEPATSAFGGQTVSLRLCSKHAEDVQVDVIRGHEDSLRHKRIQEWQARQDMHDRQRVYVACGDLASHGPLVKIGKSVDPEKRAKSLGAELLWVGSGSEAMLHRILQDHRVVGEWFEPEPVAAHFKIELPLRPWRLVWKQS